MLQDYKPRAIILDLGLPDASGTEALEGIRAQENAQDVPIILMTADRESGTYAAPIVFDLVLKPFDLSVLAAAIERAVQVHAVRHALVVDDDPDVRTVIAAQLGTLGIKCTQAAHGAEAMKIVAAAPPDLIVLDIAMPHVDGFGVVDSLREGGNSNIPLIVYSALELNDDQKHRLRLDLTTHLVKGAVSEQAFLEEVRAVLDRVRARESDCCESKAA